MWRNDCMKEIILGLTLHIAFVIFTAHINMVVLFFDCSTIIPEKLDAFINKYAEYTHDKWAFEKVSFSLVPAGDQHFRCSVIMPLPHRAVPKNLSR